MELFSPGHLVVLLVVVGIVFFGWKQLPDMARSAGRSLRVFRTEVSGVTETAAAVRTAATDGLLTESRSDDVVRKVESELPPVL
jgi:sec-independent protein translocase protein TatA